MENAPKIFGETVNQGTVWLREISATMGGWMSDDYAIQALRAGLRVLRDQLTVEQNAHLSAQLPTLIRGIFYEDWVPSEVPARTRDEAAFLATVRRFFRGKEHVPEPEDVLRSVYAVLHRHVSTGESEKIYNALPKELRAYWPARHVYVESNRT